MMSAFLPLNWKRTNKFNVFNISSAFHHIISDIIIGLKVIIHLLGDSIILLRLLNSCLHPSPLWSQTTRRSSIQAEILHLIKPSKIWVTHRACQALIWEVFIEILRDYLGIFSIPILMSFGCSLQLCTKNGKKALGKSCPITITSGIYPWLFSRRRDDEIDHSISQNWLVFHQFYHVSWPTCHNSRWWIITCVDVPK